MELGIELDENFCSPDFELSPEWEEAAAANVGDKKGERAEIVKKFR